ncbi:hypothetical protein [Mycoplasma amphoriforme]|uniref:Uncharacterized protein n=1 Tax=Mycoplasma amphoriforme A39 TaxID=572419 RepID=A0A292IIK2_9MOLU|nr:unnamed protein product [Mycoplasma amphoriforme A39]
MTEKDVENKEIKNSQFPDEQQKTEEVSSNHYNTDSQPNNSKHPTASFTSIVEDVDTLVINDDNTPFTSFETKPIIIFEDDQESIQDSDDFLIDTKSLHKSKIIDASKIVSDDLSNEANQVYNEVTKVIISADSPVVSHLTHEVGSENLSTTNNKETTIQKIDSFQVTQPLDSSNFQERSDETLINVLNRENDSNIVKTINFDREEKIALEVDNTKTKHHDDVSLTKNDSVQMTECLTTSVLQEISSEAATNTLDLKNENNEMLITDVLTSEDNLVENKNFVSLNQDEAMISEDGKFETFIPFVPSFEPTSLDDTRQFSKTNNVLSEAEISHVKSFENKSPDTLNLDPILQNKIEQEIFHHNSSSIYSSWPYNTNSDTLESNSINAAFLEKNDLLQTTKIALSDNLLVESFDDHSSYDLSVPMVNFVIENSDRSDHDAKTIDSVNVKLIDDSNIFSGSEEILVNSDENQVVDDLLEVDDSSLVQTTLEQSISSKNLDGVFSEPETVFVDDLQMIDGSYDVDLFESSISMENNHESNQSNEEELHNLFDDSLLPINLHEERNDEIFIPTPLRNENVELFSGSTVDHVMGQKILAIENDHHHSIQHDEEEIDKSLIKKQQVIIPDDTVIELVVNNEPNITPIVSSVNNLELQKSNTEIFIPFDFQNPSYEEFIPFATIDSDEKNVDSVQDQLEINSPKLIFSDENDYLNPLEAFAPVLLDLDKIQNDKKINNDEVDSSLELKTNEISSNHFEKELSVLNNDLLAHLLDENETNVEFDDILDSELITELKDASSFISKKKNDFQKTKNEDQSFENTKSNSFGSNQNDQNLEQNDTFKMIEVDRLINEPSNDFNFHKTDSPIMLKDNDYFEEISDEKKIVFDNVHNLIDDSDSLASSDVDIVWNSEESLKKEDNVLNNKNDVVYFDNDTKLDDSKIIHGNDNADQKNFSLDNEVLVSNEIFYDEDSFDNVCENKPGTITTDDELVFAAPEVIFTKNTAVSSPDLLANDETFNSSDDSNFLSEFMFDKFGFNSEGFDQKDNNEDVDDVENEKKPLDPKSSQILTKPEDNMLAYHLKKDGQDNHTTRKPKQKKHFQILSTVKTDSLSPINCFDLEKPKNFNEIEHVDNNSIMVDDSKAVSRRTIKPIKVDSDLHQITTDVHAFQTNTNPRTQGKNHICQSSQLPSANIFSSYRENQKKPEQSKGKNTEIADLMDNKQIESLTTSLHKLNGPQFVYNQPDWENSSKGFWHRLKSKTVQEIDYGDKKLTRNKSNPVKVSKSKGKLRSKKSSKSIVKNKRKK